jgi:hypothetical protein
MPVLDCTNATTALATIAGLLHLGEDQVKTACLNVTREEDPSAVDVLALLGRPEVPRQFSSVFFHAARVMDRASFRVKGIVPLRQGLDQIWSMLRELSADMCSPEQWSELRASGVNEPYALRISERSQWGPYAFVVRDGAFHPHCSHYLLRGPDIVVDICGAFERMYGGDLLGRFQQRSTPCLVKFVANGRRAAFTAALEYLVRSLHGGGPHTGDYWAFDGRGRAIPADDVIEVEPIE